MPFDIEVIAKSAALHKKASEGDQAALEELCFAQEEARFLNKLCLRGAPLPAPFDDWSVKALEQLIDYNLELLKSYPNGKKTVKKIKKKYRKTYDDAYEHAGTIIDLAKFFGLGAILTGGN